MDLSYTPEQDAFRIQVRSWLQSNVPNPPLPSAGTKDGFALHREWERKLAASGLEPADDKIRRAIFEEEYLLARGPERVTVVGTKLMAPTLMAHGSDEQQARWLPRIASAEDIWSQGFSEPGACSDLAGIRTKAELAGPSGSGEYVINGQKIWTSYGAFADWVFVLARTGWVMQTASETDSMALPVKDLNEGGISYVVRAEPAASAVLDAFLTKAPLPAP